MIGPKLALNFGAAVILAGAFVALLYTVPSRGAECAGRMVTVSWYGAESGNRTASGEPFNGKSLTAAHRSLPFDTKLRATYKGKSVVVRITDVGPAKYLNRVIDLSRGAARKLGMERAGVGRVCLTRIR